MKKVYFDTNIFIYFENKYKQYLSIIDNSKLNDYKYYYSYAHIIDLENSTNREDVLNIIENIADSNYFNDGLQKEEERKPTYFFNHKTDFKKNYISNLKSKDFKDNFLNKYNITAKEFDENIYKREKIVEDQNEHKSYRVKLRNSKNKMGDKELIGLVKCLLDNNYKEDKIILLLFKDILDINKNNQLQDKNSKDFKNISMDAYHCSFSIQFDYFVTDDDKIHDKFNYIYNIINKSGGCIETKLLKFNDFINEIK
ncbi:hypothetical protein BRSU_0665 [Brachyspira suanatina]|uniref:Uncharacterized protein n=1 Tax=Brachyspira suanatina TaxID=381802 RepID=A0A0G4K517_9SPIR|nr:hypothetical protein [Brachyspira suanatina]CRF32235.1 hypothetical protein BRSU_0665 [Brachyspira suanatina]